MPEMRLNYQPPQDEAPFEVFCLKLLRVYWGCPTLELFARRGDEQFGIDIIDMRAGSPLKAAQCKLHETWKSLAPREIEDEVSKAREFTPPLGLYAILTTAKVSAQSQRTVIQINREHARKGLFQVELLSWDRIKRLLDEDAYSQITDELYPRRADSSSKLILERVTQIKVSVDSIAAEKSSDAFDSELDESKHCVEKREYQRARLILHRLKDRKWDRMSFRQRFRLLSNIGASHLGENQEQKAANLFLEAKQWQPDDERACANEALAYQLLSDTDRAFNLAKTYREQFPNSARIVTIWIQNAPSGISYQNLEKEIPTAILSDAEVSVALAHRALRVKDYENGTRLTKQAIKRKSDWSYPSLMLAQIVLDKHVSETFATHGQIFVIPDDGRLREAEDTCSRAISLAEREGDKNLQAEALSTRGFLREILGDRDGGETDIESAYKIAPLNRKVTRDYAVYLLQKGDRNEAVRLLREVVASSDEDQASFVLANALAERNGPGDEEEAARLFITIANSERPMQPGFREEVIDSAMNLLSRGQKWEDIALLLKAIPAESISAVCKATFSARLYLRQEEQKECFDSANEALAALSGHTSRHDKRRLARLLSECGRWRDALPLWESVVAPTRDSSDVRRLLDCAKRLGRHDVILKTCQSLRQYGVRESSLLDLEISVLERYDVNSAINLLQQHIAEKRDDREMRLRLSVIGLRLERPDIVTSNPTNVPPVEVVTPFAGRVVVEVLKHAGYPNDSLKYAYELLRRNYANVEAHRAYLSVLLPFGPKPDIKSPETVQLGTAVKYLEKGVNTPQWRLIEDSPNPDESRYEISPDHHLASRLLGKQKGEEFIIAEGTVTNRIGVVEEILSKYVFRFQHCMDEWQLKFPEALGVEVVRLVKAGEPEDSPTYDITPLLKSIDLRHKQIETLKEIYRSTAMPIHMFGQGLGKNAFETLIYLATNEDMAVPCCFGGADEREAAQKAFSDCNTIVLDLTAIATLVMLDRVPLVTQFPKKVVVSQATVDELRSLVQTDSMIASKTGTLSKVDGKYAFVEETPEDRKSRIERLTTVLKLITSICQIVGCRALASIDPDKRDILIKGAGQHGAESMILASAPGHVLWTDDHHLARLALGEFGVRRVWTHLVLQVLAEQGSLDPEEFFLASARLLGWRYFFTGPSAPALMKAAELADWKLEKWPLGSALETFGDVSITLQDALRLAASFIVVLYKENILPETQQAITIRCLERLARRKRGIESIRALVEVLPKLFGLNVVGSEQAVKVIRYWLANAEKHRLEI